MIERRQNAKLSTKLFLKKQKKKQKHQDLRLQVQKLRNVKATAIPTAIGDFGAVTEELENYLKTIGMSIVISCLQKTAFPGTAFIFRRVFGITESGKLSYVKEVFSPRSGNVIQK